MLAVGTRLFWCRAQPGLMHAIVWKLLSEATTRFPWLSSRPPIRKNNSEKTHRIPAGTRKGHHQTGRHWIRTNADNQTATPQDEREPRKSRKTPHLGQISTGVQVTYILLCSKCKPHWCCCHSKRSKEGSSLLVNLRLPSTTRQKHELATDCWSKR